MTVILAAVTVVGSAAPVSAAPCPGCIVVSAPTIGLSVTAQPGGSEIIDQERGVAIYTPLTTGEVGGMGTVWLAGHRTSHGSVFNRVPSLMPGDAIDLIDDAGAHQYTVSRLLIVPATGWQKQVDNHDMSRSMLIIQTSHPDSGLRYLIEAFGTTPEPCRTNPAVIGDLHLPEATTRFIAIAPQRLLDTRSDGSGAVCADGNIELQIAGIPGIGADAAAVALTVTATGNAGPGFISVGPAGVDPGGTSSVNLTAADQSRANLVMVAVGMSGRIAIHVSVTTHLVIDVTGYYVPSTVASGGRFIEVGPKRLLDTRTDETQRSLHAGEAVTVNIGDRTSYVPIAQAGAVLVNLMAVNGAAAGYVTAWATGAPQPPTSNLSLSTVGDAAGNLAIVPLGADGAIQLMASTDLDVIVDIVGYFTNDNASVGTSGLFVPLLPQRVLDPRNGQPALKAGSTRRIDLLGPTAIRTTATLVANLTNTASGGGFRSITNGSTPSISNVNVANGETRANLVIVAARLSEPTHLYVSLRTHVIVDVTGYFTTQGRGLRNSGRSA